MAEEEESSAVGAEKSPSRIGIFLLVVFILLVIGLVLTVIILHHSGAAAR